MKLSRIIFPMLALVVLAFTSQAQESVDVNFIGQSTQDLTQTGIGPNSGGFGQWFIQQGSCSASGLETTCNLSGNYFGTTPGYTGGTYDLQTTYLTADMGANPSPLIGVATTPGPDGNSFGFESIPTDTIMTLFLNGPGGDHTIPVYNSLTGFTANYQIFFASTPACSGTAVAVCSPGEVGQTAGAVIAGVVDGGAQFTIPAPEPSEMLLLGSGLLGLVPLRRKLIAR